MARPIPARHLLLCVLLSGSFAICAAQAYRPPPPPLNTLPPCPVPKDAKDARKIAKRTDCDPTNRPISSVVKAPASDLPAADSAAKKFPFPGQDRGQDRGQDPGQDPGRNPGPQPARPVDSSKSAAQAFPYPGEAPAAPLPALPAGQPPAPSGHPADHEGEYVADPNVPHDAAAEKKAADTPAGQAFPYPGDPAPAAVAPPGGLAPVPESSSSSSSSPSTDEPGANGTAAKAPSDDDDDDGQLKLADKGSEGKRNRKTVKPQTDTERVDEDLSIAKFYGQSGNPMGAYLRAKDAVKTQPDFPEARFVLGEAAERLKKVDEAKAEFSEYLKLAPDGEHAQAAQRALAGLR